jgi:hypothetical protein
MQKQAICNFDIELRTRHGMIDATQPHQQECLALRTSFSHGRSCAVRPQTGNVTLVRAICRSVRETKCLRYCGSRRVVCGVVPKHLVLTLDEHSEVGPGDRAALRLMECLRIERAQMKGDGCQRR